MNNSFVSMLKIRLTRRGKKNKAFFRLVVAEHSASIKGKFIDALGFYNPHTKGKSFNKERIKYWLGNGAKCSDSAHNLLVSAGIIEGPKKAVKIRREKKEEEAKKLTDKGNEKTEETVKKEKPKEAVEEEKEKKPVEVSADKVEEKAEKGEEEPVKSESKVIDGTNKKESKEESG